MIPGFAPAEPIDRLIVVSHYEQIIPGRRKHTDHIILRLVHILKLIHQNIAVLPLPRP